MSQTEVPFLTLLPQVATPADPTAPDVLLFVNAADGELYTVDSTGAVNPANPGFIYGPISNGNPAAPWVCNANGAILLSRRS
jgi:hypothetical protein